MNRWNHAMVSLVAILGIAMVVLIATPVSAADGGVDTGDTSWILLSTALVFIMIPGVGLFYGGMLRKESFLSILGQTVIITSIVTLIWVIFGYSLAFGPDNGGLIGDLSNIMLNQIGIDSITGTIPTTLFMIYQLMFAIVTVCLITGAVAERMKLRNLAIFLAIWVALVYIPVAHWVWGGGWIFQLGALDFAGGTVVHISSGVSSLAAALVLGKRISVASKGQEVPHNIPMVYIGVGLLWMGWFGFNGGSALASGALAVNAVAVTHIAAAAAAGVWGLISWLHLGRPSVLGLVSGGIAGLVAITPAAGYVDFTGALCIGLAAGAVCYGGILLRKRLGFDDALDVWAVHGVGGTFGALATGLFATTAVNAAGRDGLLYGGGLGLMADQIVAVAVVSAFAFGVTFAVLKVMGKVTSLRMTKEEERVGADIVQHGESAYN